MREYNKILKVTYIISTARYLLFIPTHSQETLLREMESDGNTPSFPTMKFEKRRRLTFHASHLDEKLSRKLAAAGFYLKGIFTNPHMPISRYG